MKLTNKHKRGVKRRVELEQGVRPPGTRVSQRSKAPYRSLPAGEEATAAPIAINIGIETSVKFESPEKNSSPVKMRLSGPSKMAKKNRATAIRPNATGIPLPRTSTVTSPIKIPISSGLIYFLTVF